MKERLFILINSTNTKVVGKSQPQVEAIYSKNDIYTPIGEQIQKNLNADEVKLPDLKLRNKKAKLTDYLSNNLTIYPYQMLVSKNLFRIFEQFKGTPHQTFYTNLIDGKESIRYYLLHFLPPSISYIDYRRSQFVRTFYLDKRTDFFSVKNYQEYVNTPGLGGAKQVKALYLESTLQLPNFFPVSPPGIFLVNEDVANTIARKKITGICLVPFHQGEDFTESVFEKAMRVENPDWKGFSNKDV